MVLLEEIEFFHRITWKTFQGYTGRRIRVARFIGVKTKDCPRDIMLDVSSVTRWLSSSHCRSSPVPGDAGLHLSPPSARGGPEPNAAEPLACIHGSSTSAQSLLLSGPCGCWRESTNTKPLVSSDYISLGLGESRLSFKLSSLFPGCSWASAGDSPFPSFFLDLLCPYPSPSFFQVCLLPFMVTILAPPMHAS